MRKIIITVAAAGVLGVATMVTGTLAFARGGGGSGPPGFLFDGSSAAYTGGAPNGSQTLAGHRSPELNGSYNGLYNVAPHAAPNAERSTDPYPDQYPFPVTGQSGA